MPDKKDWELWHLGSKMIDPPVVARAQKTIDLAVQAWACYQADWMR